MIELTAVERQIFNLLTQIVRARDLKLTLRVAGGWVRDKLLGRACQDIDIAVDRMLGEEFAGHFNDHLRASGIATAGFGVIRSNPEKSKHLDTATIALFDYWIDFVNLRSESYTQDSRIPAMAFGTPEEDALRRDYTINAMFYNLSTETVEDFTRRGLDDLREGVLRTPLDARQTFTDDPLRILRGMRFAERFGFAFVADALKEMADEEVKRCFAKKIAKERVAKELLANYKAVRAAKSPGRFFQLLHEVGFLPVVLGLADAARVEEGFGLLQRSLGRLDDLLRRAELAGELRPEEAVLAAHLALLTLPFYSSGQHVRKKANYKLVVDQLKLPTKVADAVLKMQKQVAELAGWLPAPAGLSSRLAELCFWQRDCGKLWPVVELLYTCTDPSVEANFLTAFFEQEGHSGFYALKPLLDGARLRTELNVEGKDVKEALQSVLRFQIFNPRATADDYLRVSKSQK